MAFQTAITIKDALEHIQGRRYAMPAIQREFVWSTEQIEKLFDSLMQGYPIGAFLFWRVEPDTAKQYRWYSFMRDYHQRDGTHNEDFEPLDDVNTFTAVLDGQQRLTALNIGLRGSYAEKLPYYHFKNPKAYPKKELYLNIAFELDDDESGARYEFRFLTTKDAERDGGRRKWFKAKDILDLPSLGSVNQYAKEHQLFENDSEAEVNRILLLRQAIFENPPISHYLETDQDLDRVLNIFIRTNSGGTELSNSDLLLSVATAQWQELDAREEVNLRTDQLNDIGEGFNFGRDFVLRAGVVLADIGDIAFQVRNFNRENMQRLEQSWDGIMSALHTSVALAHQFGLSGGRLDSQNALIPLAYYIHHGGFDEDFLERKANQHDRELMREWLFRTLLARAWSVASNSTLSRLRSAIREHGTDGFPSDQLAAVFESAGRSLEFDQDRLEEIVDTQYSGRAFILLSMLFPGLRVSEVHFHMDHFFPRSRMSRGKLVNEGIAWPEVHEIRSRMNRLPNLILLKNTENTSKGAAPPSEWMGSHFKSEPERQAFADFHDLGDVPEHVSGFVKWYDNRRERMLSKLGEIIGQ